MTQRKPIRQPCKQCGERYAQGAGGLCRRCARDQPRTLAAHEAQRAARARTKGSS